MDDKSTLAVLVSCLSALAAIWMSGCAALEESAGSLTSVGARLEAYESRIPVRVARFSPSSGSNGEQLSLIGGRGGVRASDLLWGEAGGLWTARSSGSVGACGVGARPSRAGRSVSRSPLPGFWDTVERDLREWPATFWEDTKDVFTDRENLIVLGLTYGSSLGVQETGPDDTVEDSFQSHSTFKKSFRDTFGALGNPGTHFGLAGLWYLVGQQRQDERTYEVGTKLLRALAVNGVATLLGQVASWDKSPGGEWGTFPSGHTSSSFAFASVMHEEYGPWVGGPLYAVSALIGYSRLEDREHYLSDVIMGGVLGLVVGHTIANDGEPPRLFGGSLRPYADPRTGSSGIAWVRQFH